MKRSLEERKRELDTLVAGWMEPVFKRTDPATGRVLNGLAPADFARVTSGYGCADCLAKFTTYLITCPVCGWTRDLAADIQDAPDYWRQHLDDRASGYAPPIRRAATSIDEIMREIAADKEVDQIPMRKLKRSRWGAR